jgi:hypothetical protein
MRAWLGVVWIQAGVPKIWGAKAAGVLHGNGTGVAGLLFTYVNVRHRQRVRLLRAVRSGWLVRPPRRRGPRSGGPHRRFRGPG